MLDGIDKTFNRVSRYGSAVGRVMVRESTLLSRQEVDRMLYPDYDEALGVAYDTAYGPYIEHARVAADIESGLERFLQDQYSFLEDASKGQPVARFMQMKYDFHNLKVLAKKFFVGGDLQEHLFSKLASVSLESLDRAIQGVGSSPIPVYLQKAVDLVRQAARKGELDSQEIDTIVDRAFLEERLRIAKRERSRPLERYCRAAIDVANMMVMLRGMRLGKSSAFYELALVDGGTFTRSELRALTGRSFAEVTARLLSSRFGRLVADALDKGDERVRLTSLDRATDDYLMEKIAGFSSVSVGPERIIRYMIMRENEVAMLRIIFVGKLNSLSPAVIESRLPMENFRVRSGQ